MPPTRLRSKPRPIAKTPRPKTNAHRRFRHRPIDTTKGQIRLIKLSRDLSPDGLIQCKISVKNLSKNPRYRAISYVWGPKFPVRQILVGRSRLTIRENLWQFLDMYRLQREQDNDDFLWIDQIAIDQQNLLERNHQVKLMGNIFSSATQVIAWLGPSDSSYLSIKTALEHHPRGRPVYPWLECAWTTTCSLCEYHRRYPEGFYSDNKGSSQLPGKLIGSQYWQRLWVTQEIMLARDVLFILGVEELSLVDISDYSFCLYANTGNPFSARVNTFLKYSKHQRCRTNTLEWLIETLNPASLLCTDPRDLIFGLTGLVVENERLTIDYSLQSDEVFGQLLDRMMLLPSTCSPSYNTWERLELLESRLGTPMRWRIWLCEQCPREGTFHDSLHKYKNHLSNLCLRRFLKARWPMTELGPMVCAVASHPSIEFATKRLSSPLSNTFTTWLNSLPIPSHSCDHVGMHESSGDHRQEYSSESEDHELRRVAEYRKLIEDFMRDLGVDFLHV